jgi:hypothetical protein
MNRFFTALLSLAFLFLGVAAGATMMHFKVGLYPLFHHAFVAADAVLHAEARSDDINMHFTGAKPSRQHLLTDRGLRQEIAPSVSHDT